MAFDLFRLPQLASSNIIKAMNTTEQFLMSLCSRRTFSIIKTLRGKSENIRMVVDNINLVLIDDNEGLTSFQQAIDPCRKEIVTVNGHPTFLTHNMRTARIRTYWVEPIVGTMELIEHVSNLFGTQVNKVFIDNDSGTEFMNWMQRLQKSLRMVRVTLDDSMERQFEPEDLKDIIMECEAERIQLTVQHSKPFEIKDLHQKFYGFESFRGTWITVGNLMTLDCICIAVQEKKFTCTEMNRFIKHWVNGGSPRIRIFRVEVTEQNNEALFEGD
uniref:F-box domain-containing protein n=1 Tax=Caenorhabditis tropicalis TaxID=1561998 RepID=A0A1I7U1T5_9PELO